MNDEAELPTTLTRPPERFIRAFRPSMVEDHTVGQLIEKGWSLGICCRACPRVVEWTPAALRGRFPPERQGIHLAALLPRLSCGGPGGCGSSNVAIFPYLQHPEDREASELPL